MFIRYFVEIPRPVADVEEEVVAAPGRWLEGPADRAEAQGERLLTAVGFGPGRARVHACVRMRFGAPIRLPSKTILPMTWEPEGLKQFLPRLDADLEIAPLGAERTQLAINARYDPPFGSLGQAFDKTLLHRVAEATIKDFLDRVATAMSSLSMPVRA
jgi:hypothetical protein